MVRSERRVVITGLGLVSPSGSGPMPSGLPWPSGEGAVDTPPAFPVDGLPNDVGGRGPRLRPKTWPRSALRSRASRRRLRKSLKYMARDIQLAVAAAQMASWTPASPTAGSTRPGSASTWGRA